MGERQVVYEKEKDRPGDVRKIDRDREEKRDKDRCS